MGVHGDGECMGEGVHRGLELWLVNIGIHRDGLFRGLKKVCMGGGVHEKGGCRESG